MGQRRGLQSRARLGSNPLAQREPARAMSALTAPAMDHRCPAEPRTLPLAQGPRAQRWHPG